MTSTTTFRRFAKTFVCLPVVLTALLLRAAPVRAAVAEQDVKAFEAALERVQRDIRAARESDILEIIRLSGKVGRPYPASLAVKQYLSQHVEATPGLLLSAARNAEDAGDMRAAVSRYKNYLKVAEPGPESSAAAGALYALLIDFLRVDEDAYRFMTENAGRFRDAPAARKFDGWYLAAARSQRRYADHARWLRLVMKDAMPVPEEQLHYWDELDWLLSALMTAGDEQVKALNDLRTIAGLIRDDNARRARAELAAAVLVFQSRGKAPDEETRKRNFAPVAQAAMKCFDAAPGFATLRDIYIGFGGGADAFRHDLCREDWDGKGDVLVHAFPKLSAEDRVRFVNWRQGDRAMVTYVAPPAKWSAAGRATADWFRGNLALRDVPFGVRHADRAQYTADAAFLAGIPSRSAAAVNAVAAGQTPQAAVDYLMKNETWHLGFEDLCAVVRDDILGAFQAMDTERKTDWDAARDELLTAFYQQYLSRSPAAIFDTAGVAACLQAAWRYHAAEGRDATAVAPLLAALNWVPYDAKTRREVFAGINGDFRKWTETMRRETKREQAAALFQRIGTIENALRAAMGLNQADFSKAPDPLCKLVAEAEDAARRYDVPAYTERIKGLFGQVKGFPAQKPAWGRAVMGYVAQARDRVDPFAAQMGMLAELLGTWDNKGVNLGARVFLEGLFGSRRWNWWQIDRRDRDNVLALNETIAAALTKQIDAKQFSAELFDWMRGTRRGGNWEAWSQNNDLMKRMIDEETLVAHDYAGPLRNNAAIYMSLLQYEFRDLRTRYPPERYFDDMYVAEARKKQYLDHDYWRAGTDEKRKVANLAAELLKAQTTLALGYGGGGAPAYSRSDLFNWHARAMGADAASRDAWLQAIEQAYGKTRFDAYAMGIGYFLNQADVKTPQGRTDFFARLKAYLDRAAASRERIGPPSMVALKELAKPESMTEDEFSVLLAVFDKAVPSQWTVEQHMDKAVVAIERAAEAGDRNERLLSCVRQFWKICRDTDDAELQRHLVARTRDMLEARNHHLAAAYSLAGSEVMKGKLTEGSRTALLSAQSKALASVANEVPFDRSDPRYPVFVAQVAYLTGKEDTAWDAYLANRGKVLEMFKSLDPSFCSWIIRRHTELRQFEEAEALARPMILWMDETPGAFDPEVRGGLYMAYAGIAFGREEFPQARAQFERISATDDFKGTLAQRQAELMIAEVDRLTKNYDEAIARLEKLGRRQDEYLQRESNYLLAIVKFDQEDYQEAMDCLNKVFAIDSNHADARILEAKVFLKLKKLMEATEVKVGSLASQRVLVPGKPLRVRLEDPNLAVVGRGANVEIAAWTKSGDRETFNLLPFGDQMTKFEGQIGTELATTVKQDGKLQVLGGDVIYFDFSDAFKAANKITVAQRNEIDVVTDGEMYASSGAIVSREEQEQLAIERMIRERIGMTGGPAEVTPLALNTVRAGNQIKPGNKINVRLIDPDRSVSGDADGVTTVVSATSGDRINAFVLKETGTHTGVFEGAIPTDSSEAVAYASDSDEGKDPNFAISAGNYPPWTALPDNRRPKTFTVDIYDNLLPGRMKIVSDVPGRRLKQILLQTSLNNKTFQSVASFPPAFQAWDGSPRVEIARYVTAQGGAIQGLPRMTLDQIKEYLDAGFMIAGQSLVYGKHGNFAIAWDENMGGFASKLNLPMDGWFVARFSGGFYTAAREIRTFQLVLPREPVPTPGSRPPPPTAGYFLSIDGQQPERDAEGITISRVFKKGVHSVEVYVLAQRQTKPAFELRIDTTEPPFMAAVAADMFDVVKNPQVAEVLSSKPADVAVSEDGTALDVKFDETAVRARVFKLTMLDFETDAPAISRVELVDREGKQVLPSKQDLLALRANNVLEIVPGDKVTVSYRDPTFITKNREQLDAQLMATFHNAEVSATFVEIGYGGGGERRETYIPLRRYEPQDAITVFVRDPDRDTSDEPDKVKITLQTSAVGAKPLTLEALETEAHSGVFTKRIFPVKGEAKRESEVAVEEGDDLIIRYMDDENTDPGIPWERSFVCEQIWYQDPELRVFDVSSMLLSELSDKTALRAPARQAAAADEAQGAVEKENFETTRMMVARRPVTANSATNASVLINGPLMVEVLFPTIAKSPQSKATVYLQTKRGREKYVAAGGVLPEGAAARTTFNVKVPGTIKRTVTPTAPRALPAPPGYASVQVVSEQRMSTPLDDGRFTFVLPMVLGDTPEEPTTEGKTLSGGEPELLVRGDDQLYVGFEYTDDLGQTNWVTRVVDLAADVFFDVMDNRYEQAMTSAYVGETVYFRVLDQQQDASEQKDAIVLHARTGSGAEQEIKLMETLTHSGVFKGYAKLTYATNAAGEAAVGTFAVRYGDTADFKYVPRAAGKAVARQVYVHKGADGVVMPFTRRFRDPEIAVQTQFTLAESYFELAKRHRTMEENTLALEKIMQGKRILEEALRDFPETETRVQADYLLANLAFEFAKDAPTPEEQRQYHLEAINKLSDIVAKYPDSQYAPKAQYKKGVVYEKMGEDEKGAEEYVKLAYRYPDHELVAETIARLGQYFLLKGKGQVAQADAIEDPIQKEKVRMDAFAQFKTAGQVFGRLAPKFPQHPLAGRTGVLSGQCYMRAELYQDAVNAFKVVVDRAQEIEPAVVAEAMFWCGESYLKLEDEKSLMEAYKMYTRLRWDYPDTKWAKHARGRLAQQEMANVARNM